MFAHAVSASVVSGTSIWQSMFGFEIPATEKILRTLGVYLGRRSSCGWQANGS
jgi:hypothetical protein